MRFTMALSVMTLSTMLVACGDEARKRPLGANCTSNAECESGVCGGGKCLDPDGDEDLDGLINKLEAGLSTNPVVGDTDGDGKNDQSEVGAIDDPKDTDSDKKIDALESATADVDADCIPDELDGHDAFSDLPSDSFPNACGNGRPFPDPGDGGNPVCKSLTTVLGGSCAEALGTALAVCFDPSGCIKPETDAQGKSRVVWENGAYIESDTATEALRMFSSRGALCAEAEPVSQSDTTVVYDYRASGAAWTVTIQVQDGSSEIRCADGTVVRLTPQGSAAVGACQTATYYQLCDGVVPGQCQTQTDCTSPQVCCVFNGNGYCLPPESCPNG